MNEQIRRIIESIMKDNYIENLNELDDDSSLYSIGIDSINLIEIVIALEDHFDIEFSENELSMENFETINSINNTCCTLMDRKTGRSKNNLSL